MAHITLMENYGNLAMLICATAGNSRDLITDMLLQFSIMILMFHPYIVGCWGPGNRPVKK